MRKPDDYYKWLEGMEERRRELSAQEICKALAESAAVEMHEADSVDEGIILMMSSANIIRRTLFKLFPELDKEKEGMTNDTGREE